jgi:hypothetical protein
MEDSEVYVKLQGIIERGKGAVLWSDIVLAAVRAKEAKVREQLTGVLADMDLASLHQAHKIAEREALVPLKSASITQPPAQPAAIKTAKPRK